MAKPATKKNTAATKVVGRGRNIFQDGPYVSAALLCERILQEGDGVKTAVRIVDRTTITIEGTDIPANLPPIPVSWTLFIKLKNGKVSGKHKVSIKFINPRGKEESPTFSQEADFEGGENRGVDIVARLDLKLKHEGVYWFEIYFDDLLLTKTPLQVVSIIRRRGETQSLVH